MLYCSYAALHTQWLVPAATRTGRHTRSASLLRPTEQTVHGLTDTTSLCKRSAHRKLCLEVFMQEHPCKPGAPLRTPAECCCA